MTPQTPPMTGADVKNVQRLLGITEDGKYGPVTANAVYQAKVKLGYPKPDHDAGDTLVAYLSGKKKPSEAMKKRASGVKKVIAKAAGATSSTTVKHAEVDTAAVHEAAVRAEAVKVMKVMLDHEPTVHYLQKRPMASASIKTIAQLEAKASVNLPIDCSESSTLVARLAGAHDPNGLSFNGTGYTGTMAAHCEVISKSQAKPGDFCLFGAGTGHHVCVVFEAGSDPLLFSMGSEKGPFLIRASVEAQYQPPGVRYLLLPL